MKVEQLSIFLENKAGRLAEVTRTLMDAEVNIKALSLADTTEFGILRLIVDDHEKAKAALKEAGFTVGFTGVVAVEVPHKPGGLNQILQIIGENGINLEYMYGFHHQGENAVMIMRFDRTGPAMDVLRENGIRIFSGLDLCNA